MRHYLLPLIALLALASCKNEPERAAFETKQEQQDRIKAMYAMRAIGVEFVAMFEQASIQPDRARELATLLVGQAQALPQHFSKQPNTTSLVKPEVWADQAAFAIALSDFSRKARLLKQVADETPDRELKKIWPLIVDTGNSCTSCHSRYRVGGDPSHE